jgi:hypothetical protein
MADADLKALQKTMDAANAAIRLCNDLGLTKQEIVICGTCSPEIITYLKRLMALEVLSGNTTPEQTFHLGKCVLAISLKLMEECTERTNEQAGAVQKHV